MITTSIKYGKILTSIQEDLNTNVSTVKTFKVSQLPSYVSNLECFSIQLNKTVLNKTIKKIESLGFSVDIDEDYGFDWEVKLYCDVNISY